MCWGSNNWVIWVTTQIRNITIWFHFYTVYFLIISTSHDYSSEEDDSDEEDVDDSGSIPRHDDSDNSDSESQGTEPTDCQRTKSESLEKAKPETLEKIEPGNQDRAEAGDCEETELCKSKRSEPVKSNSTETDNLGRSEATESDIHKTSSMMASVTLTEESDDNVQSAVFVSSESDQVT